MIQAPTSVQDFFASRPETWACAELFTFTLLSGPVLRYTDWAYPVTVGGVVWQPGPPRLGRGTIQTERGITVGTTEVTVQEANASFIQLASQGFLNRVNYLQQRVFSTGLPGVAYPAWMGPVTKFFGRVNGIGSITTTTAKLTAKTALDELDNDYPRGVLEPDCDRVLFDAGCGLNAGPYRFNAAALAGSTKNTLLTALTPASGYFTQGVLTWTSGAMSGLSYMVKNQVGGTITPSYPFLAAPKTGDTFTAQAGCDKTLATCQSKFGYNPTGSNAPYFRGTPWLPDPTVTY